MPCTWNQSNNGSLIIEKLIGYTKVTQLDERSSSRNSPIIAQESKVAET